MTRYHSFQERLEVLQPTSGIAIAIFLSLIVISLILLKRGWRTSAFIVFGVPVGGICLICLISLYRTNTFTQELADLSFWPEDLVLEAHNVMFVGQCRVLCQYVAQQNADEPVYVISAFLFDRDFLTMQSVSRFRVAQAVTDLTFDSACSESTFKWELVDAPNLGDVDLIVLEDNLLQVARLNPDLYGLSEAQAGRILRAIYVFDRIDGGGLRARVLEGFGTTLSFLLTGYIQPPEAEAIHSTLAAVTGLDDRLIVRCSLSL